MSTEDRPLKRAREDEPDSEVPIQRSADYWFEDGSIVLQVEGIQFRVAKTILAMHSTVFKDMLTLPPTDEPLVEGCPVVHLSGDTPEDWGHLLAAMHPKDYFPEEKPTFASLSSVLRLSNKYDFPVFRRQCISRLKGEFPATFASYDAAPGYWSKIDMPAEWSASETSVNVVNLAREVGLYSILPCALYIIVNRPDPEGHGVLGDVLSKLNRREDEILCLRAYARLVQDPTNTRTRCFRNGAIPHPHCDHATICETAAATNFVQSMLNPLVVVSVVDEWDESWEEDLCEACVDAAKAVHEAARKECWEMLPSYFGLPKWDELLKLDLV
ncbi:BTB domain-containing protein [Mycena kentingensis (nom. inval.)]|nr:BTB domain-containing protein [Mycena kentingensis (nom. inval.)]